MGAMRFWARADLRRRWRSLLVLVVLAGVPAGVAIAAASGAARTDSVIDRLVAATKPPVIYMTTYFQQTKLAFADIARLPIVSEAILFHGYSSMKPGLEDLEVGAPVGTEFASDRTHLLDGRTSRPGSVDEAVINYRAAQLYHWKIGDVESFQLAGAGSDFIHGGPPKPGPSVRATIVGISANPGDFVGIAGPGITFGPAFARMYDPVAASLDLYAFSLKSGDAGVPEFDKGLKKLSGGNGVLRTDGRSGIAQVRRLFRVQGAALWVLSLSLGLVTALIFAQSFARQTMLQSSENGILRALGVTRTDLSLFSLARAGMVAVVAAAVAAVVAAGLSPLTPLGTARLAEPHPGFSLPAATFVGGVGVALALVFFLALVPSLIAARAAAGVDFTGPQRPSAVTRLMSRLTRRPAPAVGARFALEPGHGATAVPVRTSLTASVTGIVALLAALIVAASLQHLLATPSLYGWNWDVTLSGGFSPGSSDLRDLTSDPGVAAASVGAGGEGALFQVGRDESSATMSGVAVDPVKGTLGPTLLSGRIPEGVGEIALGTKTMQEIHARLGSVVPVEIVGFGSPANLRVVGEVVLPFDDDTTSVGEGLWTTAVAVGKLAPDVPSDLAIVRFKPGIDRAAAIERLKKRFPDDALNLIVPRTLRSFGRMSNLPVALAAMLAALAAGTLAHMLTTSIRRRRRDLAILKVIGFSRGQVRSAVGWQATVFVAVALAISIPLGIVVGRWTWRLIAGYGGFAGEPKVPALEIGAVALVALVAAALLATLPARAAARTPPALVLRTE